MYFDVSQDNKVNLETFVEDLLSTTSFMIWIWFCWWSHLDRNWNEIFLSQIRISELNFSDQPSLIGVFMKGRVSKWQVATKYLLQLTEYRCNLHVDRFCLNLPLVLSRGCLANLQKIEKLQRNWTFVTFFLLLMNQRQFFIYKIFHITTFILFIKLNWGSIKIVFAQTSRCWGSAVASLALLLWTRNWLADGGIRENRDGSALADGPSLRSHIFCA